ncbi:hypothetical protein [Trinickia mobilis]|uniref:hypothetical protein n=1 Tax=Trinickia mobilis TaxID=2816356 RepID=UPI001A8F5587|nr:hypothetical protein [Trinickia mobilis]
MDWTAVASIGSLAATGAGTVAWWMFRGVVARADANEKDLANYKLYVAEHYATQNDLTKAVASLERTIERLIEAVNQNSKETRDGFTELHRRIDGKADK